MQITHSARAILSDVITPTLFQLLIIEKMEFIMTKSYENIDLFKVRAEASQMRSEFISKMVVKMLARIKNNLNFSSFKHA